MNNLKGKFLILTKISDDVFNGNHPNNINVGRQLGGWNRDGIRIGWQLVLYETLPENKIGSYPSAWTSTVKSFNNETMILKTENSHYTVDIIEDVHSE